ncbi:hypothetical protein NDU88_006600 [Pleurodeles waltl]|uniref:Uncharacterized protein n=1 Tax=Pleurodeles waltl TaxID=8319 RepID=A0AAV7TY32_PLEWA|nr:hypothetical protein NDU88_006600 [Pleurodeles waltl]
MLWNWRRGPQDRENGPFKEEEEMSDVVCSMENDAEEEKTELSRFVREDIPEAPRHQKRSGRQALYGDMDKTML